MSKHTPGPWHATAHGSLKSNIVYDATGYAICDCTTFHGQHRQGEGDANARLIAAAPKMLALLRSLVADIDAMDQGEQMFGPFSEFVDWPLGMGVSWPNLAILRDEAKKLLGESQP